MPIPKSLGPITQEELYTAYFDCRRHKRNTFEASRFESHLFRNLHTLFEEIHTRRYEPLPSDVFVVIKPKPREVWAAQFRDRVVHHLIYNRLDPVWRPVFINNTFACIPGRGIHHGALALYCGAAKITHNWQKRAYWLRIDIENFFASIDLRHLWATFEPTLVDDDVRFLLYQIIFQQKRDCPRIKSNPKLLAKVPKYKSLLYAPHYLGLPIGNFTSQFSANVFLNDVDHIAESLLGRGRYFRYVDDMVLIGESLTDLRDIAHIIDVKLKSIGLRLNLQKTAQGLLQQGVDFVGFFILPGRIRLRNKTYRRHIVYINKTAENLQKILYENEYENIEYFRQSLASRLGGIRSPMHLLLHT